MGVRLDGWTEHFHPDRWQKAFRETGILPDYYAFRQRDVNEILPWDHIDCGVSKKFLLSERNKAYGETTTKDCRYGCVGCGINRKVKCEMEGIYGK